MYVGGARTTFGNVTLRIESKLSWAARAGRPFPEGLPCLCIEASTKLAPHLPESAWMTRAGNVLSPPGQPG